LQDGMAYAPKAWDSMGMDHA